MKVETIAVSKIKVGEQFRKDPGDLEGLAANIREMGLLQPIGIDARRNLIFGGRRLEACVEILGWKTIPCVVLHMKSLLAGQYAENEFRKQFTPSERAAIGKAIEAELGNRQAQGRPKKVAAIAATLPKGKTVDLAAKRAGFNSAEAYERTRTVTERGDQKLVEAMDSGKVSISAAAAIASQPKPEQRRIVQMSKDERDEVVRQIRQTRADAQAKEEHALDLRLYRGLYDAVKCIGTSMENPQETWEGLARVHVLDFEFYLDRAIQKLTQLSNSRPNQPGRPQKVVRDGS